jgi:hypothetical protein
MNGVGWIEEIDLSYSELRKVKQENYDMRQVMQVALLRLYEYADLLDLTGGDAADIRRIIDSIEKFGGNNG